LIIGFLGGVGSAVLFGRSITRRMDLLRINARALRLEAPLLPAVPARDEIGQVEKELEVTSELLAERSEKLRQSEGQLRAVIDNTRAGVYIKDLKSRFLLANPRCAEVFGASPERLLGKAPADLYPAERAAEVRANDERVMTEKRAMEFEEKVTYGGTEHIFLSVKVPLLDKNGEVYGLCGVSTEITERKRAEDLSRQQQEELEQRVHERTASLEQATQSLRQESEERRETNEELVRTQAQLLQAQKMEVIGTVASGVAHDFNNVLTAIMGYATLLLHEGADAAEVRATEILRAAQRAASLSRQLLGFSRAQPFEPQIVGIRQAIEESESMLRRVIGDSVELRTSIERGVGAALVDPAQFEQLLMNLVVNARDAMPTGGKIIITACRHRAVPHQPENIPPAESWVSVSVADEGSGIPAAVRARIFEPFFTTKAKGQGTGLGLATCAMIAERSGGWIECESDLGKGSTFTIYLPRVEKLDAPQPVRHEIPTASGEETILVVEDEPVVGEIVGLLLSNLGYKVLTAENGEAAERLVAEKGAEIDLILTDLNMPRMNGHELIERLVRINPEVRIILTSGNDPQSDDPDSPPLEFDFLPKPFTRQSLAEKVRQVLEA
jgi:PAS domain S-box-containing protein